MHLIIIFWKDINSTRTFVSISDDFHGKKESKSYQEIFEYLNEKYEEVEKN